MRELPVSGRIPGGECAADVHARPRLGGQEHSHINNVKSIELILHPCSSEGLPMIPSRLWL